MDKIKHFNTPKSKNEKLGSITGLMDKNKNYLVVGDKIKIGDNIGRVFFNREYKCYGLFSGLWYGDMNEYNSDCYGKFIAIPKDNGMRMEIEKIGD